MQSAFTLLLLIVVFSTPAQASIYSKNGTDELYDVPVARWTENFRNKVRGAFKNIKTRLTQFFQGKAPQSPTSKQKVRTGVRYLALGDSYASGVGSGGRKLAAKATDLDKCCFRLRNAYPKFIVQLLGASTIDFRACMGAVSIKDANSVEAQLSTAPREVDLVTVTVGGNDIGFSGLIQACLPSVILEDKCLQAVRRARKTATTTLASDIRKLQSKLRAHFTTKPVIVFTGYPTFFPSGRVSKPFCYTRKTRRELNSLVVLLNEQIRLNVDNFVAISFAGRELCQKRNKSWLHDNLRPAVRAAMKCSLRRRVVKHIAGFYHLTRDGQHHYAKTITDWYLSRYAKRF